LFLSSAKARSLSADYSAQFEQQRVPFVTLKAGATK